MSTDDPTPSAPATSDKPMRRSARGRLAYEAACAAEPGKTHPRWQEDLTDAEREHWIERAMSATRADAEPQDGETVVRHG